MTQIVSRNPSINGKDDRGDAWVISCDVWDRQNRGGLILPINPESLEVSMPTRGAEVDTYGGKNIVRGRDPRASTHFDFPVIQFTFNSGNIQPQFSDDIIHSTKTAVLAASSTFHTGLPRHQYAADTPIPGKGRSDNLYGRYKSASVSGNRHRNSNDGLYSGHKEIPVGVQNLYALFSLVNEAWVIESPDVGLNGKKYTQLNRVRIATSSLVFPGLVFFGFIDSNGLQWTESADNYNNFDVTLSLVMTHSQPKLRGAQFAELISAYKAIYTQRTMFEHEYEIDRKPYPVAGLAADDVGGENVGDPQNKTWADRVREFGNTWFGEGVNGSRSRGKVRGGTDAVLNAALRAIDPTYAADVAKQAALVESRYDATVSPNADQVT